jgi:hypothetical protein
MTTYRLYSYDVCGNDADGYEVNDVFKTSETYELDESLTDSELIQSLQAQGCIKSGIDMDLIEIEGDDETVYLSYDGKPEFELRKEP